MELKKILTPQLILLNITGESKAEIIEELLDILMTTGKVADRQQALKDLLDREAKMSTGIQQGIAIPHAKTKAVKELIACVGIKKEGASFDSLDKMDSRIFIMTLSPVDRTGPHLQFLAAISQILKSSDKREQLLLAENPQTVLEILS